MKDRKLWKWRMPENFHIKNLKREQLLILLLAGILLLVIAVPAGGQKKERQSTYQSEDVSGPAMTESEYVNYLENHLEELFSQIEGAGDVAVMVTLAASAEKVVEKDVQKEGETVTESDSQGGQRTTTRSSSGQTAIYGGQDKSAGDPYVSKEITPRVEGVVVIASGGDDARVVKNITEAVQALFGIDTHKIRIMKKN